MSAAYVWKTRGGAYYSHTDQMSGWDIFNPDINKAKIFSPKPTWIGEHQLVEVEIKELGR